MERLNKSKRERGSLSLFLWFFFVVGMILSSVLEGVDTSDENLLQSECMEGLKSGSFDEKGFSLHVLLSRFTYLVVVILLSTTSLQKFFLILQPILLALGIGAWLGAAICEFGMMGIVLVLAGIFPHMLLYILVLRFLIMLLWDRTYYDKQFFVAIFVLIFMVIIGCLLESYVNPVVVAKILKLF